MSVLDNIAEGWLDLCKPIILLVLCQLGDSSQSGLQVRIKVSSQSRNDLFAQTIAAEGEIGVRGIFPPRNAMRRRPMPYLVPGTPEQGANQAVSGDCPHSRQPRGPRTP